MLIYRDCIGASSHAPEKTRHSCLFALALICSIVCTLRHFLCTAVLQASTPRSAQECKDRILPASIRTSAETSRKRRFFPCNCHSLLPNGLVVLSCVALLLFVRFAAPYQPSRLKYTMRISSSRETLVAAAVTPWVKTSQQHATLCLQAVGGDIAISSSTCISLHFSIPKPCHAREHVWDRRGARLGRRRRGRQTECRC